MRNFPGFDERTDEIQKEHRAGFELAASMFSAWMNRPIDRWIFKSELPGDVRAMIYMLNFQAFRQFRSAIEECRIGQGENAGVLARCLFETTLAAQFILAEDFNIVAAPKLGKMPDCVPLKGQWEARGREANDTCQTPSREQRALIFKAHCFGEGFKLAKLMCQHQSEVTGNEVTPETIEKLHDAVKDQLGKEWSYIQSNRPWTYSGLSVKRLAKIAGHFFPKWYEYMYSDQSRNVHGVDCLSYVIVDVTTKEVEPRWFSRDYTIRMSLYCANMMFLSFASILNENIGMGNKTEMLLQGFLDDIGRIYGPEPGVV